MWSHTEFTGTLGNALSYVLDQDYVGIGQTEGTPINKAFLKTPILADHKEYIPNTALKIPVVLDKLIYLPKIFFYNSS